MPRLSSSLPKDPDQNGLIAIAREMLEDPLQRHLVVDCSRITTDTATGGREATVRVLRVEQVAPQDRQEAERLVRRALEHRLGDTVLPIDIERDMEAWLGEGFQLDPETGELAPIGDDVDEPEDLDGEADE